MSNNCIYHIKTEIPKVKLNQILQGDLISEPYFKHHPTDLEAPFCYILSNELHQLDRDGWLYYTVKSRMTGTIYKIRAQEIKLDFALWEGCDDVYERHEINAETVIEIEEVQ